MSLPKICTCPTVPSADCPFHHQDACGELAAMPCSVTFAFTQAELCTLVELTAHTSGGSGWQARVKPLWERFNAEWCRSQNAELCDAAPPAASNNTKTVNGAAFTSANC